MASLISVAASALGSVADQIVNAFLGGIPQGSIGGVTVPVTVEEIAEDDLEITDHPVEAGAPITDHSFKRASSIVMHCGWTNSSIAAVIGAITASLTGTTNLVDGSFAAVNDYVSSIYFQLLALQESRTPLLVTTTIRQYPNMLIKGLKLTRDAKTSQALMVSVTLRTIIIVSTQSSTLPPMANQGIPASTADIANVGPQALVETSNVTISRLPPSPSDATGFNTF
jgi:hypothetical protein